MNRSIGTTSRTACLLAALMVLTPLGGCDGDEDSSGSESASGHGPTRGKQVKPSAKQKPQGLTGFGATKEAWLATHKQAPGYTKGAAFLPMVQGEGGSVPKYGGVSLDETVVLYTINLPKGTDLDEAKQIVLSEFPAGATYDVIDDAEATCLIASINSAPVSKALRQHGWEDSVPIAAFGTSTATETNLATSNVTDVSLLPSEPGRDLGRC